MMQEVKVQEAEFEQVENAGVQAQQPFLISRRTNGSDIDLPYSNNDQKCTRCLALHPPVTCSLPSLWVLSSMEEQRMSRHSGFPDQYSQRVSNLLNYTFFFNVSPHSMPPPGTVQYKS